MINQSVLVTTQHRGVFFGKLVEERDGGKTIELENARCAIRFGTTTGFLELSQTGPTSRSKIGAVAPRIRLHEVTSISVRAVLWLILAFKNCC